MKCILFSVGKALLLEVIRMNPMVTCASYYLTKLKMIATNLTEWLKRKENVYTSPDIQNEVIKLFGLQIL